jgi:tRNA(Ile)-lysidine synthase
MTENTNRIFGEIIFRVRELTSLFHKPTILAYSGGKDSTILLYFYNFLLKNNICPELSVFHLNHLIRNNIQQELQIKEFLSGLSNEIKIFNKKKNVPLHAKLSKKSLEEAGRIIRYKLLNRLASKNNSIIVTAHHTEDYIESVLINLIRGGGGNAFNTLKLYENKIFRPLLLFTKQERETILYNENWKIFEDESNQDFQFLRNRLRHGIVKDLLKEGLNPDKIYFNFHDLDSIQLEEAKLIKIISYLEISCSQLQTSSQNLKSIIDANIKTFGLHPLKREFFLEMIRLLQSNKSFSIENSELFFWKSENSGLYLIPRNSNALKPPIFDSKNNSIHWLNKVRIIPHDLTLKNASDSNKIKVKKIHKEISELMRERNIPVLVRNNIPILFKNDEAFQILFSFWDDNLSDYPKNEL